ncbi:MAG: hypothetical protein PHI58_01340 [Candidatus Omnitrophica bacterium]|nr:hypothetical protein [Candidatus Omnitrophota bacterium]
MANFTTHISQARHNEKLAQFLLDKPFFDWSITISFYAAIHFFEARLYADASDITNKHSESSMPLEPNGDSKYSAHSWRARQIQDHYPREAWRSFRSLKEASETARYLSHIDIKTAVPRFEIAPSFNIFNVNNAKFSTQQDLPTFKSALKIDLAEFLYTLDLVSINPIKAAFISDKILDNFNTKEALLKQTKDSLRKCMTKEDVDVLEQGLSKKGLSLKK